MWVGSVLVILFATWACASSDFWIFQCDGNEPFCRLSRIPLSLLSANKSAVLVEVDKVPFVGFAFGDMAADSTRLEFFLQESFFDGGCENSLVTLDAADHRIGSLSFPYGQCIMGMFFANGTIHAVSVSTSNSVAFCHVSPLNGTLSCGQLFDLPSNSWFGSSLVPGPESDTGVILIMPANNLNRQMVYQMGRNGSKLLSVVNRASWGPNDSLIDIIPSPGGKKYYARVARNMTFFSNPDYGYMYQSDSFGEFNIESGVFTPRFTLGCSSISPSGCQQVMGSSFFVPGPNPAIIFLRGFLENYDTPIPQSVAEILQINLSTWTLFSQSTLNSTTFFNGYGGYGLGVSYAFF